MSQNFTIPEGNLTALAEDEGGSIAIGVMSIFWVLWILVSMFIPWPNSEWTGNYDAPIWYLWTLRGWFAMFNSWLPTGYLCAWVFNFIIFFIEWIAWMVSGEFFLIWSQVGLWGGLILGAFPWVCEMVYIFSEWPIR